MSKRFLSSLLILLLLLSIAVPTVSAGQTVAPLAALPALPAVVAVAPEFSHIVIDATIIVISSATLVEIGQYFGMTWDIADSWGKFTLSVQNRLNNLLHANDWIDVESNEGKAAMLAAYGGGSRGPKKQSEEIFFIGRVERNWWSGTKVQIQSKMLNAEQALNALRNGKDIMTGSEGQARMLVGRFKDLTEKQIDELKFERHGGDKTGYFDHLNVEVNGKRLHVWVWRWK